MRYINCFCTSTADFLSRAPENKGRAGAGGEGYYLCFRLHPLGSRPVGTNIQLIRCIGAPQTRFQFIELYFNFDSCENGKADFIYVESLGSTQL